MTEDQPRSRTAAGEATTGLILNIYRLGNGLVVAGDRLVAGLGLTSARWQVLGAIAYSERPQPVAWLARDLGANRQNVQRIANDLHAAGFVVFEPNPHHRRAPLVLLTGKGRDTYRQAMQLQVPWINHLAHGISVSDIEITQRVLRAFRRNLEAGPA
jgi:DNA-binding MarR family transcriptional regulator